MNKRVFDVSDGYFDSREFYKSVRESFKDSVKTHNRGLVQIESLRNAGYLNNTKDGVYNLTIESPYNGVRNYSWELFSSSDGWTLAEYFGRIFRKEDDSRPFSFLPEKSVVYKIEILSNEENFNGLEEKVAYLRSQISEQAKAELKNLKRDIKKTRHLSSIDPYHDFDAFARLAAMGMQAAPFLKEELDSNHRLEEEYSAGSWNYINCCKLLLIEGHPKIRTFSDMNAREYDRLQQKKGISTKELENFRTATFQQIDKMIAELT